jgi:hypothetical protein
MKKVIFASIVAFIATSLILCNAGNVLGFGGIKGNGNVIRKEITGLSGFEKVGNGISADMILTQGSEYKVEYEGESNLLDAIEFKLHNNALDIDNKKDNSWLKPTKQIKIYITMPNLTAIALGGSGDVHTTNDFNTDKLDIAIGGSGNVQVSGSATRLKVAIGGSGDCNLRDLKCQSAKVAIGGSGDCDLQVSDDLDVAIAGSGDVKCKGRPRVKETVAGSGSVRLID